MRKGKFVAESKGNNCCVKETSEGVDESVEERYD
jgi:hypothetical protein